MQAIILAAGRGKRMKDLTNGKPKPMLMVKGVPVLEYKIKILPKTIDEIIFVIGYCGEHIMKHFGKEFDGRRIRYVFQNRLSGTGGAIHLVKSIVEGRFLVMMGDDLYHKKDIKNMLKYELAVLAKEVDNPTNFGVLKTNRRGYLEEIVEKPKHPKDRLVNAAMYILTKDFFNYDLVSIGNGEYGLPQTLATMSDKHKIKVVKASFWHPVTTPEDLEEAEKIIHKFVR
jgi:UDP-N-acetylglucosamine diphosphorylase / glucose-1-phosphate thymidylyltransferase / UDP-N-acetylgalactosamine diphosphorylase / glucosamine-1-phosphate N-acetyltransferase / galactosamine-1-phosphate N-acetyltransferase